MRVLIDGVFFQLAQTGIARVWTSILQILSAHSGLELFFLDRGNAPRLQDVHFIPFPNYTERYCPQDSVLIQDICNHYSIDVFSSTYYTTPLTTPTLLIVYDMIPELFGFDLMLRGWMEKEIAIAYAQHYLCISNNTRDDLLTFYPEILADAVTVAYPGVDRDVFCPRPANEVDVFRATYGLSRPYFLFVGSRVQHAGYKNAKIFFDSVPLLQDMKFDIVCIGGENEIEPHVLSSLPEGVACHRLGLDDYELTCAYSGALALVYPSLHEGFGLPVIEAMACGCPVITTAHGSLAEAAGAAAHLISGISRSELREALAKVQDEHYRNSLREAGFLHIRKFSWDLMAQQLAVQWELLVSKARTGAYAHFFREWKRLRLVQADVDFLDTAN